LTLTSQLLQYLTHQSLQHAIHFPRPSRRVAYCTRHCGTPLDSEAPWQMGLVGQVLKRLPNRLYDWAISKAPKNPRKLA